MDLFPTDADLLPFIFRITDNGGETYDRITVALCDGDALLCSTGTICAHYEDLDPQVSAERVESGNERDLRWIDLDEGLRRRIRADLNYGYSDWLDSFTPPVDRNRAQTSGTASRLQERVGEGVYGVPGEYFIRREDAYGEPVGQDDLGPYQTLVEAVRNTLPEDYDLSGPEYHSTVRIDDVEGGPAPLWDREADPPKEPED